MTDPIIRNPLALGDDALGENPEPIEVPAEVLQMWANKDAVALSQADGDPGDCHVEQAA